MTPSITHAFDGGIGAGTSSLELSLDLTSNTQAVTLTISFANSYAAGVSNVSFTIFDIDLSNGGASGTFQDQIRSIAATSTTGATIAPTITGVGPNVTLTGTGINQTLTGNTLTNDHEPGSSLGNVTISFNAPDIRSVTFTYGGGPLFADPTYEHIGLYNVDYSVVPEPSLLCCFFLGGLFLGWIVYQHVRSSRGDAPPSLAVSLLSKRTAAQVLTVHFLS